MLGSRLSLNRFAEWIERRSLPVQLWLWALVMYAAPPNQVSEETPAASCLCLLRTNNECRLASVNHAVDRVFMLALRCAGSLMGMPHAVGRLRARAMKD